MPHALARPPSPWQAVDEEIQAPALGDKVDSCSGLVHKVRRMWGGAERRKHSKQANMAHVAYHGYAYYGRAG